jgi:uncharacterized membrane protein
MFFVHRKQVDEDVEKIRQYTLAEANPEKLAQEIQAEQKAKEEDRRQHDEAVKDFTAKDVVAMSIAVFQILLPVFLIMFAVAALVVLYFVYMGSH